MSDKLSMMRQPFPAHQISYLPKGGTKLAYVGHAALTDRLLDVDPAWSWEPLALDTRGLPAIDEAGGMWIKLTVCGVTRLGYGDAGTKKGGDAMKERIGDALRNAAMRFGAALDLWHKGDLHGEPEPEPEPKPEPKPVIGMSPTNVADWTAAIAAAAPDEIEDIIRDGLAAAEECNDKPAWRAIRDAGNKRREALENTA